MRFESLHEWLNWLETCHPNEIDLGLERVAKVKDALDLDFDKVKIVTVAGTNGKGSCVSVLQSVLTKSGYKVGSFTSPHFLHFNERIVINGTAVKDEVIIDSFHRIDQCREAISLTYFEFATLASLDVFSRADLDVVILEVGLGGRLDSVNIIDPDIAIVTSIDIDHVDWLGPDRESIGYEKAGIFRANIPAICADPNPPKSVIETARSLNSSLYLWGQDFKLAETKSGYWRWDYVNLVGKKCFVDDLTLPQLPIGSIAAAFQAIELLELPDKLSDHKIDLSTVSEIRFAGRFQQLKVNDKKIVLDVAHNPAAARHLALQLESNPVEGRTIALCAIMVDKDIGGIIEALKNSFSQWNIGDLEDNSRAIKAADLAQIIKSHSIEELAIYKTISEAFQSALRTIGPSDRLVVFGSTYTVAQVMQQLPLDELQSQGCK